MPDPSRQHIRQRIREAVDHITPVVTYDDGQFDETRYDETVERCREAEKEAVAEIKLQLQLQLKEEEKLHPLDDDVDNDLLTALIAVSDHNATAKEVLSSLWPSMTDRPQEWLVDGLLTGYLRPLFRRHTQRPPAGLTATGRVAAFSASGSSPGDIDVHAVQPWQIDPRVGILLAFCLDEITDEDDAIDNRLWPVLAPMVLAMTDAVDSATKTQGLRLAGRFVQRLRPMRLQQSGLAQVIAEATMPALLQLPPLTPVDESVLLLREGYGVLLKLARQLSPSQRKTLLDRVLREGIFAGYFHASDHFRVVRELLEQTGRIVKALGIHTVKHIKDILPILNNVLTDPFALHDPPTVLAAVTTLQTVLTTCWPRMAHTPWQGMTTQMLVLCWLEVEEKKTQKKDDDLDKIESALVRAAATLAAILRKADVDMDATWGPLVAKEPLLVGLLGGTGTIHT